MRTTFILILVLILAPSCYCFADPVAPAVAPAQISQPPVSIIASGTSSAPAAQSHGGPVSLTSVPTDDPIVKGKGAPTGAPNIPKFPVEMYVRDGKDSHFELFFLNVKYDYDLSDFQFYNGWCLRKGWPLPAHTIHVVRLYNSSDPNLPPEYKRMPWHQINYLINHKKGSKEAVQQAIWRLAKSPEPKKVSAEALRLIREANLKGKNYTPGVGDLVAIVCAPVKKEQPIFIEFKMLEGKPPVVKGATFFSPAVSGFGSRIFFPFFPYFPSNHDTPQPKPPVQEPSSLFLLAAGLVGILIARKSGNGVSGPTAVIAPHGSE